MTSEERADKLSFDIMTTSGHDRELILAYADEIKAEAIREAADRVWISVDDRLPEATEWCLVYSDGAVNCMAWDHVDKIWGDWTMPKAPNITDPVTHWMSLPKPPAIMDDKQDKVGGNE